MNFGVAIFWPDYWTIPNETFENQLRYDAITGCDTVSALYRKGKRKALTLIHSSNEQTAHKVFIDAESTHQQNTSSRWGLPAETKVAIWALRIKTNKTKQNKNSLFRNSGYIERITIN